MPICPSGATGSEGVCRRLLYSLLRDWDYLFQGLEASGEITFLLISYEDRELCITCHIPIQPNGICADHMLYEGLSESCI